MTRGDEMNNSPLLQIMNGGVAQAVRMQAMLRQPAMPQPRTGVTRFQFGRLLCRQVRDYLAEEKFLGRKIEWNESSGWFVRSFTIMGDTADVTHVGNTLMAWCREIERKKQEQ